MKNRLLVMGICGAVTGSFGGVVAAAAATQPVTVLDIPAQMPGASEAPQAPLVSSLSAKQIISSPTGQRLVLEASTTGSADGITAMRSLAVYDSAGRVFVPAVRSALRSLVRNAPDTQQFELPEGLPDGLYYAELLTAYTERKGLEPMIPMSRLHFQVVNSEVQPLTAAAFEELFNAQDVATFIQEGDSK